MRQSTLLSVLMAMLILQQAAGQTKAEWQASRKNFEGIWVNKKTQRHLMISFATQGFAEINDWQGKSRETSPVDAYKAWIKDGKLIMPESKSDLRSPYCEIVAKGKDILYRCRRMNSNEKRFIDSTLFVRSPARLISSNR